MKTFILWLKFNLVGMIGVAVQLTSLALFNRLLRGHYQIATVAALELTLLNNFAWHLLFTWRDVRGPVVKQLLQFHLSNGLVSLLGNLVVMRLLVNEAHLPVLDANAVAIACCSLINFFVSHYWIFGDGCLEPRLGGKEISAS